MIILVGTLHISVDIIGFVDDQRLPDKSGIVAISNRRGNRLFNFTETEADTFMTQYTMYVNNRNRQFEMGYAQTLAYYQSIQAQMMANQESALESLLAKTDTSNPQ